MSDSDFGDEESRLSGRVRRYARVGGSVGGLAARIVGARVLGLGLDRVRHILAKRRKSLEATARELMQQEVIDAEELARIIKENSPSPLIVPGTDVEPKLPQKAAKNRASDSAHG